MFGMGAPTVRQMIKIKGKTMDLAAVEAFMNDLYGNAGLELADDFNPVDEVTKVVLTLREQGKQEVVNET